jgi:hypothetical protein
MRVPTGFTSPCTGLGALSAVITDDTCQAGAVVQTLQLPSDLITFVREFDGCGIISPDTYVTFIR